MALGSYWSFIILPRLCWKHEEAAVYLAQAYNEGGIWQIFIKGTKSSQHTVCWSSWQKDSHPETQGENSTKEHYFTFSIKYVLFFHVWGTCITLFLLMIYLWQDGIFFSQQIILFPFVLLLSSSILMYMVYTGSILLHIDHFHSLVSRSEQQFPHFNSPEANLFHLTNKNVFAIFSCRCRTRQATKHHCFCWVYCH